MIKLLNPIMNFIMQGDREKLPIVKDLASVRLALESVIYVHDRCDWTQKPELTWGIKKGDCEDFAHLAMKLLDGINIFSGVLSVICKDKRISHAVCLFMLNGKYSYFSNSKLIMTDTDDIKKVVFRLGGNQVRNWKLINIKGELLNRGGSINET
jgi:hypothetical protein